MISYFWERFCQYRQRAQKFYQGFRKITFSFCFVAAIPPDLCWLGNSSGSRKESRLKEMVFFMLFPFTQVESNGKVLVWYPLVTTSLQFPKVLRTIGGISLSFWLVCLFALKLNAILQLRRGSSQPQRLGAGGSINFSRIWGMRPGRFFFPDVAF